MYEEHPDEIFTAYTIFHFMVGFITHQRTVEVKKYEGAISNGKSFDGTGSASKSGNTWE